MLSPDTPLKFDELNAMLLEEELRLKTREGREGSTLPKKKKFNGSCFYCDNKGHTIKDC